MALFQGTDFDDTLIGGVANDTIYGAAGNDVIAGADQQDSLFGEAGNDTIHGDNGKDLIDGGSGFDMLYGDAGKDRIKGGADNDLLDGGAGRDVLKGGAGDDTLTGGDGNDRLIGGNGADTLSGGAGNDRLVGGKGGDHYVFASADGGHDVINDKGSAPTFNGIDLLNADVIELSGYASATEGMHGLGLQISGADLTITYEYASAPGLIGTITIVNQFAGPAQAIDLVSFGPSGSSPAFHIAQLSGDNYTYSIHSGPDQGGEDIVIGTNGNDQIYGGIGSDVLFGAAGRDHFMFQDEGSNGGGNDLILDFEDGRDLLDFTEIKTLTMADLSIADNAAGNAVVSSLYGTIELDGVSSALLDAADFVFF